MGKMSELDFCIGELRIAAQSLTAVADSLTALLSGDTSQPVTTTSFCQSGESCVQMANAETVTIGDGKVTVTKAAKPIPEPTPITLEQVRTVLAKKSRTGHTADIRTLLEAHGANKLSEIDPKEYPALLAEGSRIGLTEGDANG